MCQMGGAGVAMPLDSTSGNVNPALMANVGRQAAIHPLMVLQDETVDTSQTGLTAGSPLKPWAGAQTNRMKVYGAAYSGFNYDLNPNWAIGFSTAGGGNNTRYLHSIISPDLNAPRRLESAAGLISQIFAYKPDSDQSYGLSLIGGVLRMKNNLTQFPSGMLTKGANKADYSLGIGTRLGGQWNIQKLSFGFAVNSPIFFQKLKKYSDVMPKAPRLPVMITGGTAWHINKETDLLFDLEGALWKSTSSFGKTPPTGQRWKDVLVYKFGVQQTLIKDLKVRAGYNYGRSPIPNNQVLFSALSEVITVSEHILTSGFTYDFTEVLALDLGLSYMFPHKITDNGKGVVGPAAAGLRVKARALVITTGFNLVY